MKIAGSITTMKIAFVLYCKPSGTYNGENGKSTKDLTKAALFNGEQAAKNTDHFFPNFEFLTVRIDDKGVRTLEY